MCCCSTGVWLIEELPGLAVVVGERLGPHAPLRRPASSREGLEPALRVLARPAPSPVHEFGS